MRILHIASGDFFSTYGGGQVYVKNVVDTMINMGMDIAVISITNREGITKKTYNGIPLIEISSKNDLEAAIQTIRPSVIHAHSLKDNACKIGKKLCIPVVVTSHHGGILCPAGTRLNFKDEICNVCVNHKDCLPCVLRNTRGGLRWWYPLTQHIPEKHYISFGEWLKDKCFFPFITPIGSAALHIKDKKEQFKEIAQDCTLMIAPCQEIADAMIQNGLDKKKIKVILHGIPLPPTRPEYPNIINSKIKFYYVGRICYVKGIHTLLKAFSMVKNPMIELHLIGGTGNKHEKRYMEMLKKRFAPDSRIMWHGKIAPESVFEATKNFHVALSPAIYLEVYGLNIAEALALGNPVLATRSGGAEMQIRDGENGWLVPTNDAETLADKIKYISDHPEILPEMSDNCHAISIERHCSLLYDTYRETESHQFYIDRKNGNI